MLIANERKSLSAFAAALPPLVMYVPSPPAIAAELSLSPELVGVSATACPGVQVLGSDWLRPARAAAMPTTGTRSFRYRSGFT